MLHEINIINSMELTAIIISLIITFTICYLILFFALNSLDYPDLDINKILTGKDKYKVLVIYPHPDDETMASGGLMAKLAYDSKYNVKCVTITTGQKGDELIKLPPKELGDLRAKEFASAMKVLKIKNFEAWNFMDGNVRNEDKELRLRIKELLDKFSPDLIITYEKSGVYGHPDHVALSRIVTDVSKNYPAKLLYTTISDRQAKFAHLPYHMAEEEFSINRLNLNFQYGNMHGESIGLHANISHRN